MSSVYQRAVLAIAAVLVTTSAANAQVRPYIGYVYPAGGQQGTTFRIKLGGQNLDDVVGVIVSGKEVSGKVVQYLRKLGPQDMTLLNEQLAELKKRVPQKKWDVLSQATGENDAMMGAEIGMVSQEMMSRMSSGHGAVAPAIQLENLGIDTAIVNMVSQIRARLGDYVQRPASVSISSLVLAEITVASDAKPGRRELRIVTPHGVSNPMVFYVGRQLEASRRPMSTSPQQVLGKEALALPKRHEDAERRITIPCTVNGQIASAEVHRYRFAARKGQRLVISTVARELVPFIADAVPGWFQPVMTLYDAHGKEVAYNDDYRFTPDPMILFDVLKDGEYVLAITDAIFRGREDFIYRAIIDELPLVTSIFPLGVQLGTDPSIAVKGWNLDGTRLNPPAKDAMAGVHFLKATKGNSESNPVPFALDTLSERFDKEPNNRPDQAQKIELPVIINGRIDGPDDWDVFRFTGQAGETIVAEVEARRLNSPLDSVLKLTDAQGRLLAINDDHDDPAAGTNTHYADSYLRVKLPRDGTYYVHLGDTTRNGGEEYAYRLRISGPRPDFALRVVPSSVFLRRGSSSTVSVYVDRKDGCEEPIKLFLKNPPEGISASAAVINGTELVAQLTIKAGSDATAGLFELVVEGSSKIGPEEVVRQAVPAEDRMQAFLWRHLVPADELKAYLYDPQAVASKAHRKAIYAPPIGVPVDRATGKPKFTKQQVAGRLRMLNLLFEEGLLTPEFHHERVVECGGQD